MKKIITVKSIRGNNKNIVFSNIVQYDGITRAELASNTKLSLMTISNVVDDLLNSRYVYEVKNEASIGRTPMCLYPKIANHVFVCINLTSRDCGEYVLYDIKQNILSNDVVEFDSEVSYEQSVNDFFLNINAKINMVGGAIIGVGLAIPGSYDENNDEICTSLIAEQRNIKVAKLINEILSCDNIVIKHDTILAGLAEYNKIDDDESMFYLYIGEGVGGCYINGDRILMGQDSLAGEIGQIIINANNLTIEKAISTATIRRFAIKNDMPKKVSLIMDSYKQNINPQLNDFMNNTLIYSSILIHNIIWQFNPKHIIIGSSCTRYAEYIADAAIKFCDDRRKQASLERTAFGSNTTIIDTSYITNNASLVGLFQELVDCYINLCTR